MGARQGDSVNGSQLEDGEWRIDNRGLVEGETTSHKRRNLEIVRGKDSETSRDQTQGGSCAESFPGLTGPIAPRGIHSQTQTRGTIARSSLAVSLL